MDVNIQMASPYKYSACLDPLRVNVWTMQLNILLNVMLNVMGALRGCLAVKFYSCNKLLSYVDTIIIIIIICNYTESVAV